MKLTKTEFSLILDVGDQLLAYFAYSDFTLIAEIGKANPPCFDNLLNIHMNRIIDREGRRNLAQLVVFAYIISNNSQ